jgi:L-seryl-tRNA(Ser) seleniumtransferase
MADFDHMKATKKNIFEALGLRTVINARGTWTYLSGALVGPEVIRAMVRASKQSVEILDLQRAVGKRLAKIAGTEAGMVTSGAAAALAAATAGCMTGTDPDKIFQLPDTSGMRNEVVLGRRSVWDSAIRLTGAKLILADSIEKVRESITEKTAMVYWGGRENYSVEDVLPVCKKSQVPLFVDVASSIPCRDPVDAFTRYGKMGVDLYAFSGGKGLCGPQSTGVLLGRAALIEAALANYSPWEGSICRPMKVGKEEIVGTLAAVEAYLKRDHEKDWSRWTRMVEHIAKAIRKKCGVSAVVGTPQEGNYRIPHCIIRWEKDKWGLTADEMEERLKNGTPSIVVYAKSNPSLVKARILTEQFESSHIQPTEQNLEWIAICPLMLNRDHEGIIAKRVGEIFSQARGKVCP